MRVFLILLLSGCFAACEPEFVKVEWKTKENESACLVDSATYHAAYKAKYQLETYYYSKILVIKWKESTNGLINGHALCLFVINTGKFPNPKNDSLWTYDRITGSRQIPVRLKDKPLSIAIYLFGRDKVEYARFLE